ncbi:hypothetical protein L6452_13720 [Arctium lappa]|uniref:Uncharacterized protein n=1 Tax=Arctium lappa TaxID=4217 RepID=A0ACB9CJA2_ARCLA|nr:hypothetical protein L6452_13720 [Arctium lappa]
MMAHTKKELILIRILEPKTQSIDLQFVCLCCVREGDGDQRWQIREWESQSHGGGTDRCHVVMQSSDSPSSPFFSLSITFFRTRFHSQISIRHEI